MNTGRTLFALLKADFLERTRRSSFLVTLCLVIYLGYSVNTGQILIKLEGYRGVYNSAWVGSLMALVITFFLGITGFYLVKNTIERDERTGVGQIIATTPITRPQYLLGKWLSNFAVLSTLVMLLALAAILMQAIQQEDAQIHIWALIAPFLFVALPMMALVAAFAVFFETVSWLKGGFGNLVYFGVFITLFMAGIFLTDMPWLDVTGISLIGSSMKAAVKTVFPDYQGSFVLAMISDQPLKTFIYSGLNWSLGLILQRAGWLVVSAGLVLFSSLFFNRFNPAGRTIRKAKTAVNAAPQAEDASPQAETAAPSGSDIKPARLTPLGQNSRFHFNFFRLAWLECLLLVKGLKWYWLAGMAVLWVGSIAEPGESARKFWFMLCALWPVLIWSKMGEREVRCQAEQLVYQAAYPTLRLSASAWLAGVTVTALAASGVLFGRLLAAEPVRLTPWVLSVLFIPTLAIALGTWTRSSKAFEVIYPILWYLGPFNRDNGLAVIDYLGIHAPAPVNTAPLLMAGFILLLMLAAYIGRRRQAQM